MHEGFIIDLLDELSAILGFNYTIYEAADKGYGSEVTPGEWDGMIGDLMERDSGKVSEHMGRSSKRILPTNERNLTESLQVLILYD